MTKANNVISFKMPDKERRPPYPGELIGVVTFTSNGVPDEFDVDFKTNKTSMKSLVSLMRILLERIDKEYPELKDDPT